MTVVVNLRSPEEEKVLLAFLNSLQYDYKTTSDDITLTGHQEKEIIRRDTALTKGETSVRNWDEIKKDLENVYR
ncbi:MAG: hypothetical protein JWR54_2210 [Mucilaginibacter sp.]|nr:hypothetical protein [Mucilaginibacter sp.]